MKLIVGLGNPGIQYETTRHNVGFLILDDYGFENPVKKYKGEFLKKENLFLKPLTFMNKSGESVIEVKNFFKLSNEDILVIFDDLDLELGRIQLKRGGSSAGHNGIKSITQMIGEDYYRLRVGIGRPLQRNREISNWVLSPFTDQEVKTLEDIFEKTRNAIENFGKEDISKLMNRINTRPKKEEK